MKNNTSLREISDFKLYSRFSKLYNALVREKNFITIGCLEGSRNYI